MGKVQFAAIRSESASSWLAWVVAEVPAGVLIWPAGYRRLAVMFAEVVQKLGLADLGLTLASFRAGGASYFHRSGVEPGRL